MAKMRPQYSTTQTTMDCHVVPDQIAPKQARCTRINAIDDGYMMSSFASETVFGLRMAIEFYENVGGKKPQSIVLLTYDQIQVVSATWENHASLNFSPMVLCVKVA
jgi:hypothetical protein